jgi:glycosyltransferase involved in cell wall biosynthesis
MKFSIITCTYNSEKYLQNNIDSCKKQTYQNFEHIFIDGNSQDKTATIINEYKNNYPSQVKLFSFPPKGIANAMDEGIKKAQGEYLIHLHSDDTFNNAKVLEKVAAFLEQKNNPDWIYGKANFINTQNNQSRIIPHRRIYHKARLWLLLLTNYLPHQAVFLKKDVFQKYGLFDETLKNAMDYEYWLRLTKNKVKSTFIDLVICNFSVRPDSQSERFSSVPDHLILLQKYVKNNLYRKFLEWLLKINSQRKLI